MAASAHPARKSESAAAKANNLPPKKAARAAGLVYVEDTEPGFTRQRQGRGFRYVDSRGRAIKTARVLNRIRSLVIPPAWTNVWICKRPSGHLQATGRDVRGRKQYRYHPEWRAARDENKYERLIDFAKVLPRVRQRVSRHLRRRGLPREKVLATIVKMLESTLVRVGNDEYVKSNRSFGLTTMKDGHAKINGAKIRLEFRGKSGKRHEIDLRDERLARIVQQCQDLPGQELFQYVDADDEVHDVTSGDVNEYLRQVSGGDFTAKDFRTWAGTALAARALQEFEDFDSQAAAKRNITRAIERVAQRLGNTTAICRKCYVHPAIIDAYLDRSLVKVLKQRTEKELRESLPTLTSEEAAVLALLQQRMERDLSKPNRRKSK
jgi:DNA topoisomerase-1